MRDLGGPLCRAERSGNWRWRFTADMQSASALERLRDLTTACHHSADQNPDSGRSQSCSTRPSTSWMCTDFVDVLDDNGPMPHFRP